MEGGEFIEYGMGLARRNAGPRVCAGGRGGEAGNLPAAPISRGPRRSRSSARNSCWNWCRTAEMVKFCKDGSHAVDGAVRLARAYTGRDMVAICGDHPFFSTNDWFIGTTEMNAGIPEATRRLVVKFRYNDLASLEGLVRPASRARLPAWSWRPRARRSPRPVILEAVKRTDPCQRCAVGVRRNDHRIPVAPERCAALVRRDARSQYVRQSLRQRLLGFGFGWASGDHAVGRE